MLVQHNNKTPSINPTAYIAPNACICGDVRIGKNTRVLFGAQLIAENNPIVIGNNCIILENAVLRGCGFSPLIIGNNCLVGPHTHLASCTLEDEVFVATGASIFHGAVLKKSSEVRINAVVHCKSVLAAKEIVPINWVAVGKPTQLFPPYKHEAIWTAQQKMNFNQSVYGKNGMSQICDIMSQRLGIHLNDLIIKD